MSKEKKQKIKSFFGKIKKINFSFGSDGDKDWVTIFFVSMLLFIAIFVWSFYIYIYATTKNETTDGVTDPSSALIDQKGLKEILTRYDAKKKNFDATSTPALLDPAK